MFKAYLKSANRRQIISQIPSMIPQRFWLIKIFEQGIILDYQEVENVGNSKQIIIYKNETPLF